MTADRTRLRLLRPDAPPVEGIQSLPTDLRRFFVVVERVGTDSGVLLLTIRALRQRSAPGAPLVADLVWMLRASRRRIRRWLDTLSDAGLVVYDATDDEVIVLEVAELAPPPVFSADADAEASPNAIAHEIPTHYFIHVLPRVGRRTFAVYLYLIALELSATTAAGVGLDDLAAIFRLRSIRDAERELARLARHRLVARHPSGVLLVKDPPPLTRMQRRLLTYRAKGLPPHVRTVLRLLALAALVLAPILYLLLR